MGRLAICKKDPDFYLKLCVKIDKKLDLIPGGSYINNTIILLIKPRIREMNETLSGRAKINANPFYVHAQSKSIKRILLLCIPILGNFIVALVDYSKHKEIQKEQQGTTPDAYFRLANRYLKGDGVTKDFQKAQGLLFKALKGMENDSVRSLFALQYLERNFISKDELYERAASLIRKMNEEKELSKLLRICHKRSKLWEFRIMKFKSKKNHNQDECQEMETIKQDYDLAADVCIKKLAEKSALQDNVEDKLRKALG